MGQSILHGIITNMWSTISLGIRMCVQAERHGAKLHVYALHEDGIEVHNSLLCRINLYIFNVCAHWPTSPAFPNAGTEWKSGSNCCMITVSSVASPWSVVAASPWLWDAEVMLSGSWGSSWYPLYSETLRFEKITIKLTSLWNPYDYEMMWLIWKHLGIYNTCSCKHQLYSEIPLSK